MRFVPKWRKMTWALVIWCAVILIWAIGGGASTAHDCANQQGSQYLSAATAKAACDTGDGIGIALILMLGFFGFIFLSIIWFMSRPKGRDCPACGTLVKRGRTACSDCGHDFVAALRPASA